MRASLAASTGVEDAADVAAYLLAGADVVMTTSSLLRHGPGHAALLVAGLADWLKRKEFSGVGEARGLLSAWAGDGQDCYGRPGYLTAVRDATRAFGAH